MDQTIIDYRQRLLQLPAVVEIPSTKKRFIREVNLDNFTGQQRECFDGLLEQVSKNKPTFSVLSGYAGTGKTFTMSAFVEYLLVQNPALTIAQAAPTNKAVKVMKEMAAYEHPTLHYSTIHSMLGLKEKIDGYGRIKYIQDVRSVVTVGNYKVLIIDESSMLSDELFDMLVPYFESRTAHIIFVGDPCQIPPVGKSDSKPFDAKIQEEFDMRVFSLTDIVRQSENNPIIQVTKKIRSAIERADILPVREDAFDEQTLEGVYYLDMDSKDFFYALMKTHFDSENFKKDSDFVKIVAYRNKTVDTFNALVRKFIYGVEVPKICVGEKMIADKPIKSYEDNIVLFSTNEEFEVLDFEIGSVSYRGADFKYYHARVAKKGLDGILNTCEIRIIHEDSEEDFNMVAEYLKSLALAEPRGSYQAASKWEDYYRFFDVFAQVKYNYAITGHKSQGSTYKNCIVLEADIDALRRVKERNRIKYTAFTRPMHRLFVVS